MSFERNPVTLISKVLSVVKQMAAPMSLDPFGPLPPPLLGSQSEKWGSQGLTNLFVDHGGGGVLRGLEAIVLPAMHKNSCSSECPPLSVFPLSWGKWGVSCPSVIAWWAEILRPLHSLRP